MPQVCTPVRYLSNDRYSPRTDRSWNNTSYFMGRLSRYEALIGRLEALRESRQLST
jgi:hypothetical protein